MTTAEPGKITQKIRIYNSLTRAVAPLEPIVPGHIGIYACGSTVYDHAHIGHGMYAVIFDMIRRYLMHVGYDVRFVQNFTDIDDKIIERATREHYDFRELTDRLIAEWNNEILAFNILPPTVAPRATEEIPVIVEMIEGLINGGHAYESGGDVFFRVRSSADYGKLSNRNVDQLLAGTREHVSESKRDPLDFALWKAAKPGEPNWDSPWGAGRPGWHIECSAMCMHHLEGMVDIHGGGRDLIFPHHENEIAQSEAYNNSSPFARVWVHNGMLQLRGEKMSKSLGNVIPIQEIIDADRAAAFRLLVLQTHYRSPINFTDEGLAAAETGLSRLRAAQRSPLAAEESCHTPGQYVDIGQIAANVDHRFHESMNNDFDSPGAIAAMFDLGRAINRAKAEHQDLNAIREAQSTLGVLTETLGIDLTVSSGSEPNADADPLINLLISVRNSLRKDRHFAAADMIRDGLQAQGIALEDTAAGTHWTRATGKSDATT